MSIDVSTFGTLSVKNLVSKNITLQDVDDTDGVTLIGPQLTSGSYSLTLPVEIGNPGEHLELAAANQLIWGVGAGGGIPTTVTNLTITNNFSANHGIITGELKFGDNKFLYLGDSDDLQLVHDATNSKVISTTGNLIVDNTNTTGKNHYDAGSG